MSERERGTLTRDLDVVVPFVPRKETKLTPEQETYWWEQLEIGERKVEYAKRMLGILAIEKGVE